MVIAGGVAWVGYDAAKESLISAYKQKIEKQFADGGAPAGAAAGAGQQVAAAAVPTGPTGNSANAGKPMGAKTEDGYTIFETPLDEEDLRDAYGNKDAKVTVVKYSDFECPYCKYLALTMEPLKPKYKDKVRFIMKHFPMNPNCNRFMQGYDKHPNACNAHIAGVCAGRQGKFWEMHDKLYANQPKLAPEDNRKAAEELGLDLAKYDACVKDPTVQQRLNHDIDIAMKAGIYGAPRTYINGRLVTGSASTAILEYYIQKALENPTSAAAQPTVAMAPKPDGSHMVAAKSSKGQFFIDPYEAALAKDGKAVSLPGVEPAMVSWTEADEACKKAGKRLCSEEEWVAACSGTIPKDNNNNGQFADDDVEGNMYPYGTFYETGICVDQEDKYKGKAGKTGVKEKCRTPSGIFDLAGNMGEWSGVSKETAGLMGGHNNSGERAACNQRSASFGVGNRNQTTGFRCCADSDVQQGKLSAADLKGADADLVGKPVPAFSAKDSSAVQIDTAQFKGKVTLINFFASWCGPCKKEFPELVTLYKEHKAKGFQVVSIGVDREEGRSLEFAKGFETPWGIVADPESELMGKFGVYSMPATFIVDRQGVIRYYDTGFKPEEQLQKLRDGITKLL
jgi:DsbE subfamily thiol:disulfide oxidoreductase